MKQFKQPNLHGFTLRAEGIARMLAMDIEIIAIGTNNSYKTKGIWDTGATSSVITKEAVEYLGLSPTGVATVNTASATNFVTNSYTVNIALKQDVIIQGIEVTMGTINAENGFGCLIGMDIIALGDFSITNLNGKTCMSFRLPSLHEVDYVKIIDAEQKIIKRHLSNNKKMDDKCVCGSGAKFKNCHGKNLTL